MQIPKCDECPAPSAIAQYREPDKDRLNLCEECVIRYVRVAGIKGLLLTVAAFDRRMVEASYEPPPDGDPESAMTEPPIAGFKKVEADQSNDPAA